MNTYFVSALEVDSSLKRAIGLLAWNVKYDLANLTMEFGEPRIELLRKPSSATRNARRRVAVRGDVSLWIYAATWRVLRGDVIVASRHSKSNVRATALADINGEILKAIEIWWAKKRTRFVFDLGTVLEVFPRRQAPSNDLWRLFGKGGYSKCFTTDEGLTQLRK